MFQFLIFLIPVFIFKITCSYSQPVAFNAEVDTDSTFCILEKGNLSEIHSIRIRINNKAGLSYSDFKIPYKESSKIIIDHAWIEDQKGKIIRKLRNKDVTELNANHDALYQDYFYKKFSLEHNTFPYWIDLRYIIKMGDFLSLCNWTPVYDTEIPVHQAYLKITVPINYRIKIYENNIRHYTQSKDMECDYYAWNASYKEPLPDEIYSPPIKNILPVVKVLPLKFNYGVDGDFRSWETFGNWVYRLNEGLDILPLTEQDRIRNLVKNETSDIGRVKKLYHYMEDHTRYVEITIDIGGLKPFPASFVANNKYGDCKALTNYLRAALSVARINSYYTLIEASAIPSPVLSDFASQDFNHAILTVPLGEDTIWLENTSNINPFGYMGTMTQGRLALLVDKDNSHLIKIPSLKPEDVCSRKMVSIHLGENNSASVNIRYEFRGRDFELFNYLDNGISKNDQDDFIRAHLDIKNFEIEDWKIEKQNRDIACIGLDVSAKNRNYIRNYGPFKVAGLFEINIPVFEAPAKRTLPVNLPYPFYNTDSTIFISDNKIQFETVPRDTVVESAYGKYSRKSYLTPTGLIMTREILINAGNYTLSEYPNFYDFIERSIKEEKQKLLFK